MFKWRKEATFGAPENSTTFPKILVLGVTQTFHMQTLIKSDLVFKVLI